MSSQAGGHAHELLPVLEAYRDVTQKLYDLTAGLSAEMQEKGPLELDGLEHLLRERAAVIAACTAQPMDVSQNPVLWTLTREIQALDDVVTHRLQHLKQATQDKMRSVQTQKRGLNGYNQAYVLESTFIDKKK